MTFLDQILKLWSDFLGFISAFIIPDWTALVNLLPILLVVGVLGPILSLMALYWLIYSARAPRRRVRFHDGPRPAPLDDAGIPRFPSGEPYCAVEGYIYPGGATRCTDGHELSVICPKCGVGRKAAISTCGNCGLVLRIDDRPRALAPAGPPPGGAAAA